MVRQLSAIKLRSMWNTTKSHVPTLILTIIGTLYLGGLLLVGLAGLLLASITAPETAAIVLVVSGTIATLVWLTSALLRANQDPTLDPARLATYLPPSPQLAVSLVVATGVGPAGGTLFSFAVVSTVAWLIMEGVAGGALGLIGATGGTALALVWTQVFSLWLQAHSTHSRRAKERKTILFLLVLTVGIVLLSVWGPALADSLIGLDWQGAFNVGMWSPVGAFWSLPYVFVQQGSLATIAHLSVGIFFLVWGLWLVNRQLRPAMTGQIHKATKSSPQVSKSEPHSVSNKPLLGVGFWIRLGVSPATAGVAARTQAYWYRDPRLLAEAFGGAMILVVALCAPYFDFSAFLAIFFLVLLSFLMGMRSGTILQYDSTAYWVHVASGISGREDRLGRTLGSLPFLVILPIAASGLFSLVSHFSSLGFLTLFACLLLMTSGGYSAALIIGSQWVYPIQPPGTSPLSSKGNNQLGLTMLIGSLQFLFCMLLVALPLGFTLWCYLFAPLFLTFALVGDILWSVFLLAAAIFVGGRILDAASVEILTKMSAWPGHKVQA